MTSKTLVIVYAAVLVMAASFCTFAQSPADAADDDLTTMFPHSQSSRYWVSGQFNTVVQGHPSFGAKYTGENSLRPEAETRDSRVFTLYTGLQLSRYTEALFDVESTGGRGISDALGLAGFTNLDVVRNPALGPAPYVARAVLRQIIPLSHETIEAERGPLSLATAVPARRLEVRVGKFSLADFFDVNSVGSDSHLQFLNWTVDNNGAWDYAADTRGYTFGAVVEYQDKRWGLRFAEALMPVVANGPHLQWNLRKARAENMEFEWRNKFHERQGTVRLLSFVNHADMGDYRRAVLDFLAGRSSRPDIETTRRAGTIKYGFGLNLEQEISGDLRTFARLGWNEGRHESFAYTEVDQTVAWGADYRGTSWGRKHDRVGAAYVSNGISGDHQRYLALGGRGFLLGDGELNYGREMIFEGYYTLHVWRGISTGADFQHISNPGYNRDRGPVWVPAFRLHVEL